MASHCVHHLFEYVPTSILANDERTFVPLHNTLGNLVAVRSSSLLASKRTFD
jgi:hypothetical protein